MIRTTRTVSSGRFQRTRFKLHFDRDSSSERRQRIKSSKPFTSTKRKKVKKPKWAKKMQYSYVPKEEAKQQKRVSIEEGQKTAALRLQSDPVWACETVLGATTLWEKQREILRSVCNNRRTAVRSSHGAGK